jgi:hypothetical protein
VTKAIHFTSARPSRTRTTSPAAGGAAAAHLVEREGGERPDQNEACRQRIGEPRRAQQENAADDEHAAQREGEAYGQSDARMGAEIRNPLRDALGDVACGDPPNDGALRRLRFLHAVLPKE